jgi:hypothetical protein
MSWWRLTMYPRPDWKYLPTWAMWIAMDRDGAWTAFENHPFRIRNLHFWIQAGGSYQVIIPSQGRNVKAWGRTLQARPTENYLLSPELDV